MNKLWLALALALLAVPAMAIADDNPPAAASPALTPAQRQAISNTMQTFRQKERQMHQQLRSQILAALSPDHRTAVANVIGEMVISASPDPMAAAKQIDGVLSPAEQQAILSAHNSFVTQSQALHEQMRAQLQSEMPAGAASHMHGSGEPYHPPAGVPTDPGSILMMILAHHGPMEMGDHHPGMPEGPPPGGPPPGQAPPPGGPPPPRSA